ncbi:hypothetical protein CCMA1212_006818 [Trichoderma ghanense]|uniref:Uncharacterized protein n=1 Tax=Trichoderma ghanense TaxID=65468 RepID=A0ABY2GZD9_9HYPO
MLIYTAEGSRPPSKAISSLYDRPDRSRLDDKRRMDSHVGHPRRNLNETERL